MTRKPGEVHIAGDARADSLGPHSNNQTGKTRTTLPSERSSRRHATTARQPGTAMRTKPHTTAPKTPPKPGSRVTSARRYSTPLPKIALLLPRITHHHLDRPDPNHPRTPHGEQPGDIANTAPGAQNPPPGPRMPRTPGPRPTTAHSATRRPRRHRWCVRWCRRRRGRACTRTPPAHRFHGCWCPRARPGTTRRPAAAACSDQWCGSGSAGTGTRVLATPVHRRAPPRTAWSSQGAIGRSPQARSDDRAR
jgi:hypothetical protein